MFKNEKGSVLSVALIMVAILSFSITSVTAYTQNVTDRSNELIQDRGDDVAARSILNQALYELKAFINDDLQPADFSNLSVEVEEALTSFIESLENTYTFDNIYDPSDEASYGVRITDRTPYNEAGYDGTTATFRIYFDKFDGTTIFRDMFVSLEDEDIPDTPKEVYDNIIERVLADKENLDSVCTDENDEKIEGCDTADEFDSSTGAGDGSNRIFNLETNVYIPGPDDDDESLALDLYGHRNHGILHLNGYTMIVDGDLKFDDLTEIHGDGVLIVRGDFILEAFFEINIFGDVLFIVEGSTISEGDDFNVPTTILSIEHGRHGKFLESQDDGVFTLMTIKRNPQHTAALDTTNIERFQENYWLSNPHPDEFIYLGTEPFSFFNQDPDMPSWAEIFIYYGEEFPPGTSFSDGSFRTE